MSLPCDRRLVVPIVLILGLCSTGCRKAQQTFPAVVAENPTFRTGPATVHNPDPPDKSKVNPAGPFPIVGRTLSLNEMKQLGLVYLTVANDGKSPAKLDDLGLKQQAPKMHQAVEEKGVILYWGVNFNNVPDGTSNTILGYNADVPKKGGAVLMMDGSVKTMTVDEFNKAPKAGQ